MSYIGNPPVVQASRVITELVATAGQTDIYPLGGYTPGDYLDVEINGSALKSTDYTATDGVKITLAVAMAAGDDVRVKAYGNFTIANSVQKTGDTMTGPLTVGGLLGLGATGQIKFPATQNPSSDANTLDDYEEGTWTPTDGSGAGLTFTNYGCTYTKVGNTVSLRAYMSWAITANTNGVSIAGLPFASNQYGAVSILSSNTSIAGLVRTVGGQTKLDMKYNTNDSTMTNNQLSNCFLIFSLVYQVQ